MYSRRIAVLILLTAVWGISPVPADGPDCLLPLPGRFAHNSPARVRFYESWLRQKMGIIMAYTETKDWSLLMESPGTYLPWQGTAYAKVVSVPMLPSTPYDSPESRMAALDSGATGAFDPHWIQFAAILDSKYHLGDAYIRLGWEFNCAMCGWPWAPDRDHREQWIAYWKNIVRVIRKNAPQARIVWCLGRDANDGRGSDPNGVHDSLYYPGDEYVDVIGIDTFDSWPPARDEDVWRDQVLGGPSGLAFWSGFAKRHGKPLAIPEWGMVDSSMEKRSFGGDNPFYIRKMFEFITDPGNRVLFQIYTGYFHGNNAMEKGIRTYRNTFGTYYRKGCASAPSRGGAWTGKATR
jgi:hypothetical protein